MSRPERDACLVPAGTAIDHGDSMTNTALAPQQSIVTPTAATWAASHLTRLAALAGSAWMALGIESIVRQEPHNYRDVLMYGPWVLLLATIVGIHQMQRHRAGRLERFGYVGMTTSMAVALVLGILMLLGAVDGYFAVTMPVWILSLIMFGIGTARGCVPPLDGRRHRALATTGDGDRRRLVALDRAPRARVVLWGRRPRRGAPGDRLGGQPCHRTRAAAAVNMVSCTCRRSLRACGGTGRQSLPERERVSVLGATRTRRWLSQLG